MYVLYLHCTHNVSTCVSWLYLQRYFYCEYCTYTAYAVYLHQYINCFYTDAHIVWIPYLCCICSLLISVHKLYVTDTYIRLTLALTLYVYHTYIVCKLVIAVLVLCLHYSKMLLVPYLHYTYTTLTLYMYHTYIVPMSYLHCLYTIIMLFSAV